MDVSADDGFPIATGRQVRAACARSLGARRWQLLSLLLVLFAAAVCGLSAPYVLGSLVDIISRGAEAAEIVTPLAIMVVAVIAGAVLSGVGIVLTTRLLETVLADLREQMVDAVLELPQHRVEQAGSGDVLARAVDDVAEIAEAIPEVVPAISGSVFALVLTLGAMTALSPWYALGLLLIVPIHVFAVRRYLDTAPAVYAAERRALSVRTQSALDALHGLKTLRAYRMLPEHERRIGDASRAVVRWTIRAVRIQNAFFGNLNVAEYVGMATILTIGFLLVGGGGGTVGSATTAMLLFLRLFDPINGLLFVADHAQSAYASLGRIIGVTIERDRRPRTRSSAATASVVFRGVTHRYGDGRAALAGVDLHVEPGETVAIVGASGAGKSTLAALAAGVHVPTLGGVSGPAGQGEVVLVTQEVQVFAGTLRENLTLIRPEVDDDAIRGALAQVGALPAVKALPEGLDTRVGAGGIELAPDLAQLIALARVQLRDPKVVILDEATAEAGSRHANVLDRAARIAADGRTALVVTHRLSQAAEADRIVVLDHGRIVESGTHAALLDAGGPYARIWRAARSGGSAR